MVGSKEFHRHVLTPASDLTNEDQRVKDVAAIFFNEPMKAKYQAKLEQGNLT